MVAKSLADSLILRRVPKRIWTVVLDFVQPWTQLSNPVRNSIGTIFCGCFFFSLFYTTFTVAGFSSFFYEFFTAVIFLLLTFLLLVAEKPMQKRCTAYIVNKSSNCFFQTQSYFSLVHKQRHF